jgi:hypothetical protein
VCEPLGVLLNVGGHPVPMRQKCEISGRGQNGIGSFGAVIGVGCGNGVLRLGGWRDAGSV